MSESFETDLDRDLEFLGPFSEHRVVLRGRRVPHLTATPLAGGRILLILDDRMSIEIAVADAPWLVPFMADCIMVGAGYTGFPDVGTEPTLRPIAPRMVEVGSFE